MESAEERWKPGPRDARSRGKARRCIEYRAWREERPSSLRQQCVWRRTVAGSAQRNERLDVGRIERPDSESPSLNVTADAEEERHVRMADLGTRLPSPTWHLALVVRARHPEQDLARTLYSRRRCARMTATAASLPCGDSSIIFFEVAA